MKGKHSIGTARRLISLQVYLAHKVARAVYIMHTLLGKVPEIPSKCQVSFASIVLRLPGVTQPCRARIYLT
jgi:hypothetical protein